MDLWIAAVISDEWPTMRDGEPSPAVDARIAALEEKVDEVPVSGAKQAAAFDHLSTLNNERRNGRQGRIAEASPLVPPLVWLILIIGAVVVIGAVCSFADPQERPIPQAALIASIAGIVVSGLLLVRFLDKPYENQSGSIKPTAMTRSLALMQRDLQQHGRRSVFRCG